MKNRLQHAMFDSENYVVEMVYSDSKGNRTRRNVSPIRFVGKDRFLGLCLCREEPRQFYLSRCEQVRLVPASEVMMPMPMEIISTPVQTPAPALATPITDSGVACLV